MGMGIQTLLFPLPAFREHGTPLSWFHRMVWVGRGLYDHPVPTPCYRQGHLPLDQVAQSPIQPGLECFQGGGIHNLTGQPVPVSHYPYHKKPFCLYISFSLKPFPLVLSCPYDRSLPSFPVGPLQVLKGCYKVLPEPSPD